MLDKNNQINKMGTRGFPWCPLLFYLAIQSNLYVFRRSVTQIRQTLMAGNDPSVDDDGYFLG